MTLKHVLKYFNKTEVQEDKTHPTYLSQTILNRLFGRVLEREGELSYYNNPERYPLTLEQASRGCKAKPYPFIASAVIGEREELLSEQSELSNSGEGYISCAKHTLKHLFSYSPIHLFTSKKVAFTLAEVLITLAIIGVVSALTISNVIQDYQKKQTVVQLRKVYNDINNAVKLSEIDNGPMSQWDYVQTPSCSNYECLAPFLEKYYLPFFKDAQLLKWSDIPNYSMKAHNYSPHDSYIRLNSGVLLKFFSKISSGYIWIYADINGEKGPNIVGRDIFIFDAYSYAENLQVDGARVYRIKFWNNRYSNKDALTSPADVYSCRKDNNQHYANFNCGRLIELNNWEIPKDYPW